MTMVDHVKAINALLAKSEGMDVVIISTSSSQQAKYWKERLERVRASLFKPSALILTVHEDWPGGAGNGLGTLYTFQQAQDKALKEHGVSLIEKLKNGESIAIYHTSGYGQRLAPLTTSELNNKSAICLPSLIGKGKNPELLSILEAVIRQTGLYSKIGKGRLSVFWGDQIFIPSVMPEGTPQSHVEILGSFDKVPDREGWEQKKLYNYGLLSRFKDPETKEIKTQVVDKIHYDHFRKLAEEKRILFDEGLGTSLGSFNISLEALTALLEEFSEELHSRSAKMDSDPYIWVPATMNLPAYIEFMGKLNQPQELAEKHYDRIQKFLARLEKQHGKKLFFGSRDVGSRSYWWDYGTHGSFWQNNLKLLDNDEEAKVMRTFYHLDEPVNQTENGLKIKNSILVNSQVAEGEIQNSVVINVHADRLNIKDCVVLKSNAPELKANKSLVYNVIESQPLKLEDDTVRADACLLKDGKIVPFYTSLKRDSKVDWKSKLPRNEFSYQEMYENTAKSDQTKLSELFESKREASGNHRALRH